VFDLALVEIDYYDFVLHVLLVTVPFGQLLIAAQWFAGGATWSHNCAPGRHSQNRSQLFYCDDTVVIRDAKLHAMARDVLGGFPLKSLLRAPPVLDHLQ